MPKKILFFTNTSYIGGAERNVLDLAECLTQKNYSIHIAALEKGGPLLKLARDKGIKIFNPKFRSYVFPTYLYNIYFFLKKHRFDYIFVYGLKLKIIVLPIASLCKKTIKISTIVGLDNWKNSLLIFIEKKLMRFTTFWIANSHAAKRKAIINEGKPEQRIHVVYNGLPIYHSQKSEISHSLKNNKFKVITIANIEEGKGHYFFLKVINKVTEIDSNITFEFIGHDYSEGKITEEITKMNLQHFVFLSGYIEDVRSYIRGCDLMVLPSLSESLPTSIIECMLESIPVIATNVGGIPELISHDETGWLVEPLDEDSLVKVILSAKTDKIKRDQIIHNALKFANHEFDINKISKEYEFLLNKYSYSY